MSDSFYASLPAFAQFEGVTDPGYYRPLPDDWLVATSDIVGSTVAIKAGRYKAVNMAGASVISATLNALGHMDIPFIFGGDGAVIAVPGAAEQKAREALAAVQAWVADEMQLTLRIAIVPMRDIRAHGLDVRVAKLQAGAEVFYAMFSGGGASWAEQEMRSGRFVIAPAPSGTRPDLSGLSCRWSPIVARHGEILSVIAIPGPAGSGKKFEQLVADVVALADGQERSGHPVPEAGPNFDFPPRGADFEARARTPKGRRLWYRIIIVLQNFLGVMLDKFNLRLGRFDPKLYRRDVAQNSDFRKFDDGLKMTVDLSIAQSRQIEDLLEAASRKKICVYGIHRQNSALMTCIVPSPLTRDHMHFIDGGSGGYAMAASQLKAKAAKSIAGHNG